MSELERLGPIDRTPGIPGSDKNVIGISAVHENIDNAGFIFKAIKT